MLSPESAIPVACVTADRATLGESPIWDAGRNSLWWIDCTGPALHRHVPATGADTRIALSEPVHAIGLRGDGGLIAAMAGGLARLDPDTGAAEVFSRPEAARSDHRFNDGKCGPDGRFWVGSMHRSYGEPTGRLFRVDPGGAAAAAERLTVPNGLGWSPDATIFYLGDSPTGTITAFAFDAESGALSGPRPLIGADEAPGWPDGLAVDSEGFLWNARWDGGCVVRIAPDGRLDRTVTLPVTRPTSCAFGGPGLDRLYVTSARLGLDGGTLDSQPLAGGLFALDIGIAGLPPGLPVGTFAG